MQHLRQIRYCDLRVSLHLFVPRMLFRSLGGIWTQVALHRSYCSSDIAQVWCILCHQSISVDLSPIQVKSLIRYRYSRRILSSKGYLATGSRECVTFIVPVSCCNAYPLCPQVINPLSIYASCLDDASFSDYSTCSRIPHSLARSLYTVCILLYRSVWIPLCSLVLRCLAISF